MAESYGESLSLTSWRETAHKRKKSCKIGASPVQTGIPASDQWPTEIVK